MNAEGSNTSIRYEDNASNNGETPESETSTYVVDVKGDDQNMTEIPETEETKAEPKTEQELLLCKFCEFQATDLERYVNHVLRPSHIKKAAEAYNIRLTTGSKDSTGLPKIFHCQACVIACNGENAWNQHLIGQKHRKVLEKKSADVQNQKQNQTQSFYGTGGGGGGPMKTNHYGNTHIYKKPYEKALRTVQQPSHIPSQALGARDFANYIEPLIGLEYVTEIQVIGQSPKYQCSLCDAKFDHNLKFPHLVGAKHRMNVLKIKRPDFLNNPQNRTQKRSELTALLLREAQRLEQEEGRQQVKTKVEKSPFFSINNSPTVPTGYQGVKRGQTGRGGFTRGGTTPRGNRGTRGGRGTSTRGSRGNRGSYRGRGGQASWSESYGDYSSQPTAYNYNNQPYNASYDSYNHSNTYNKQTSGATSNYMYPLEPFSTTSQERLLPPPPQIRPPTANITPAAQTTSTEDQNKPDLSAGLAGALGDLTKLVQNEDDASVALHVSNALTQALLQFRMTGIQDEGTN